MQVDVVALELRPRSAWEAVDLGQAMWRRWWLPVHAAWFATFLPVAIGLAIVLPDRPIVALLLLWWLLPLFERGPVFVLGRLVFGGRTRPIELLRELPQLWTRRVMWRQFAARLSPWRGFLAPVAVLERQSGAAGRKRGRALAGGGREAGVAIGLTSVCWTMQLGTFVLLAAGLPTMLQFGEFTEALRDAVFAADTVNSPRRVLLALYACGAIAMSAVGPLYAACGFALYLNRRTFLEGWDVSVAFRALARRVGGQRRTKPLVGVLALFLALVLAPPLRAQVAPTQELDPKAIAQEVLAHQDFDTTTTVRTRDEVRTGESGAGVFGAILSQVLYVVLVVAGVALLLYLVFLAIAHRGRKSRAPEPGPRAAPPVQVAGLDVRPESIPDDPAEYARDLWRAGRFREALGLLYRAAIAELAHEHRLPIADGDTEGDCLRRADELERATLRELFAALTRAWQACAYGGVSPRDDEFAVLCDAWCTELGGAS